MVVDPIQNLIYKLPPNLRPIIPIVGGMLILVTYGTIYTSGNIQPYIASYLRKYVDPEISSETMVWIFTLQMNFPPFGISLGGLIERKYGIRIACLAGALSMSVGCFMTYFTIQYSYFTLLVTFGMLFGLGQGLAFGSPIVCAMKWLPERKGLATGLVLAGLGAGGLIFSPLQTAYVNPWNHKPDRYGYFHQEELLKRVPTLFLMLGGCYVGLQIIGCLLLTSPKREVRITMVPDEETYPLVRRRAPSGSIDSIPTLEAVRSSTFWWLFFGRFFSAPIISMTSSFYKQFGQTFIKDDIFLAVVGSAASIFNASGRIFWGWLADKYSFQVAMAIAASLQTFFMVTFLATEFGGKAMYIIWVCGLFFGFSSNFALFPLATVKAFGPAHFQLIYGVELASVTVASILMSVVADTMLAIFGYMGIWFISAGFVYCTFLLVVTIQKTEYGFGTGSQMTSRKTEVRLHYTDIE